jgi:AraC-like DNA-binding protein/quercetin dioxygenase-like cupin family protein
MVLAPRLRFASDSNESGLSISVRRFTGDEFAGIAPHVHSFLEMLVIERGTGKHRLGATTHRLGPGGVLFIAPGELHDLRLMGPTSGWILVFEAVAVGRVDQQRFVPWPNDLLLLPFWRTGGSSPAPLQLDSKRRPWWVQLLTELDRELCGDRSSPTAARALLELLLIDAGRHCSPGAVIAASARPVIAKVFQVIDSTFADQIRLNDIAFLVGRSPAYLTDLMRRNTGRTVMQWLVERRIAEARWRLVSTEEEIAIIGERSGYPDPAHFPRVFRGVTGFSPSAYRKNIQVSD